MDRHKAFERGQQDCAQDGYENAPFASVGGLVSRAAPVRPKYIEPADWPAYLFGYSEQARDAYGESWPTVAFVWSPALTINDPPPKPDDTSPGGGSGASQSG